MGEAVLANVHEPEALRAAARSRVFGLFAEALGYPERERLEAIRRGEVAAALLDALAALDPALAAEADAAALREAGDGDDLAVEYTRLFDVGAQGPPCPLYGGLYGGARMKVMEEAVRFYNHFGLQLAEEPRELPDHLLTELEFLHFLAYREAEALHEGSDAGAFRRAQRDFVARHPGRWVPTLRERLLRNAPPPYLRGVVDLLARVLEAEGARLVRTS